MLVDDITIKIRGGHGGRGAVAFERNKLALGPTGAAGGHGGSVYFEGVSDIGALNQFRFEKERSAQDGEPGQRQYRDGRTGEDITLKIPVGTVIHNLTTGFDQEILQIGEKVLGAKGGLGGKGNFYFRSSRNTSPKQFQPGIPGEDYEVRLELKLIADVGLVGLPNAGKSSLINELTNAKSKVANYQFTTLEPHLGAYYGLILADLPGLIEGAAEGKGLGLKFLRHVERTRAIFHLISAESEDVLRDYEVIKKELGDYSPGMLEKNETVFLTKVDSVSPEQVEKQLKTLAKKKIKAIPISVLDDESLKQVKKILDKLVKEKTKTDDK
jgi:GTP-binding protein